MLSDAVGTVQRVEKLLHAPLCVPFKDLKPRFCSVSVLVSECFDPVFGLSTGRTPTFSTGSGFLGS